MISNLSPNRIGDINELKAVSILMEEGWEVFRNCGADGPIDIVIINKNTGEIKLLDIKTAHYHIRKDGTKSANIGKPNKLQEELGVEYRGIIDNKLMTKEQIQDVYPVMTPSEASKRAAQGYIDKLKKKQEVNVCYTML